MAQLTDGIDSRLILFFWGKPKVGKTVLASQFPNITFLDMDDSLGSVRAMRKQQEKDFSFRVFDIKEGESTDEEMKKLIGATFMKQTAWRKFEKLTKYLSDKMTIDETLVIDNTSRMGEALIHHIKTSPGGYDPMQIQNWMDFTGKVANWLEDLKKCRCNVVLIGHEEYLKDDVSGELERMILMPTKMRHRLPSVVTDYLYMKTEVKGPSNKREVKRKLQSMPDQNTATGSRALIPDIENPTYEKIKPYMESALGRNLPDPTWTPTGS